MTLSKTYFFLGFLLFTTTIYSQGEANNWYFGENAGVNFNTTPPIALTNGRLNTTEGCSAISDTSGTLLFYTDGRIVYNRNHEIMPGGTGLLGDKSSTSSALIIPKPQDSNIYYIFTLDEPTSSGDGLNYSAVDLRLDGGLGDVLVFERNIPLITYDTTNPEETIYKCSEKITAIQADDCDSVWVLTHFKDKFYAFKVTATGVNATPEISTVSPKVPIEGDSALGYLKASPDGKKLVIAHPNLNKTGAGTINSGGVYLHNFDNISGIVSSTTELINSGNPYGVEFSPRSQKVYASVQSKTITRIFQWDLESADIPNSITTISEKSESSFKAGGLQLAPNGKIYVSTFNKTYLSVINRPEAKGAAANYSDALNNGAINLKGRKTNLGLPPFIQSLFRNKIGIIDTQDPALTTLILCESNSKTLSYDDIPGATYTWYKNKETLSNKDYFLDINTTGSYQLEVNLNDKSCTLKGIATVVPPSETPIITNIYVEGFSQNSIASIFVAGTRNNEYAVDNPDGPYQDSPDFVNLDIGKHIAYSRDKNGCGQAIPKEFSILRLPEFFSPNNDGQNDFWQVEGFQEIDQEQAKIAIFDRYGKLLKTISPSSKGWDGTYNGQPLLQSDYWVRVQLSSGVILSSHFSLLR